MASSSVRNSAGSCSTVFTFMMSLLILFKLCCQGLRLPDVTCLRTLITATEQDNQHCATLHVVDPVAWAEIYLQLDNAPTNAPRIAGISLLEPVDPRKNS